MRYSTRAFARLALIGLSVYIFFQTAIRLQDISGTGTENTEPLTDDHPWTEKNLEQALSDRVSARPLSRRTAMVVASQTKDNTSWLVDSFPEWDRYIYVVDDENATLTVPRNKGRESMVYLSFIIDNYDSLPHNTLFLHSGRYQWHNDDPDYDGLPMLRRFQIPYLEQEGYVNMRCGWTLGCPVEIRPKDPVQHGDKYVHAGRYYLHAFEQLFPGLEAPDEVGVGCCAQFAVTREMIRERPKADYVRYRDWLLNTDLEDSISGRVLEYSWHIIFGQKAQHCPNAAACYCKVYGLCNLVCEKAGECDGRYILPPFSNLPKGWPYIGWKGEPRNRSVEL